MSKKIKHFLENFIKINQIPKNQLTELTKFGFHLKKFFLLFLPFQQKNLNIHYHIFQMNKFDLHII